MTGDATDYDVMNVIHEDLGKLPRYLPRLKNKPSQLGTSRFESPLLQ